ncbi:MAG: DJ-1/PfpI family protein [Flavonifractor plautii]
MVAILLGTGFEESEALVPADLLRRAGVEVRLVGVDGPAVTSAHGVTVTADLTLAELDREAVDMLVLPGGLGAWRCSRATATYRP